MKTTARLIAILAAFVFSMTAHAQTLTPLKAGDPVNIQLKVPAEDAANVSGDYSVSTNGTVRVPYLDREIGAAGLNTTELARRIEQAYKAAEIYTNPAVIVNTPQPDLINPHIVVVGGEVRSPRGDIPLRNGMRLYQAIISCGGPTEFADMRKVKLSRGSRSQVFDMRKIQDNGSNNPILMDGDTIHIPQD